MRLHLPCILINCRSAGDRGMKRNISLQAAGTGGNPTASGWDMKGIQKPIFVTSEAIWGGDCPYHRSGPYFIGISEKSSPRHHKLLRVIFKELKCYPSPFLAGSKNVSLCFFPGKGDSYHFVTSPNNFKSLERGRVLTTSWGSIHPLLAVATPNFIHSR